jgi:hypothetical protein
MAVYQLFGCKLSIVNNPALASAYGDYMAIYDSERSARYEHAIIPGKPEPQEANKAFSQLRERWPHLEAAAAQAARCLAKRQLRVDQFVITGDEVVAYAHPDFGYERTSAFPIVKKR